LTKHERLLPPEDEARVSDCIGMGIAIQTVLGPGFRERIYFVRFLPAVGAVAVLFMVAVEALPRFRGCPPIS
jgi:hypothetical protein